MKTTRILLLFFAAMLGMGVVSCDKDDNGSGNGGNNGGGNEGNGGGDSVPAGWVDLGLPSGLLWAECNLGANNPEEYGRYYAWGETQPKDVYAWSTYCYFTVDGEGTLQTITKYNIGSHWGVPDDLTILEAVDDAAAEALDSGARIPTKEEWQEMLSNTTEERITLNGVTGRRYTAANGNTIFLPAAGFCWGNELLYVGYEGRYWSSSLVEDTPPAAWIFYYQWTDKGMGTFLRCGGASVRAVRQS